MFREHENQAGKDAPLCSYNHTPTNPPRPKRDSRRTGVGRVRDLGKDRRRNLLLAERRPVHAAEPLVLADVRRPVLKAPDPLRQVGVEQQPHQLLRAAGCARGHRRKRKCERTDE